MILVAAWCQQSSASILDRALPGEQPWQTLYRLDRVAFDQQAALFMAQELPKLRESLSNEVSMRAHQASDVAIESERTHQSGFSLLNALAQSKDGGGVDKASSAVGDTAHKPSNCSTCLVWRKNGWWGLCTSCSAVKVECSSDASDSVFDAAPPPSV